MLRTCAPQRSGGVDQRPAGRCASALFQDFHALCRGAVPRTIPWCRQPCRPPAITSPPSARPPNPLCRHGLAVGAHLAWLVHGLMWLTSPISYPIALLLDWILGEETVLFR